MKFGVFYEHQLPRPWDIDSEHRLLKNSLDEIELADQLGFDYAWEVEHHFLEEYSHSSAPEVFLAAASQRTKNIRLGHGIVLPPTSFGVCAGRARRMDQDLARRRSGGVQGRRRDLQRTRACGFPQTRIRAGNPFGHRRRRSVPCDAAVGVLPTRAGLCNDGRQNRPAHPERRSNEGDI